MFDAKKLLDAMVAGTSEAGAPGKGGLGDILNQALNKTGQAGKGAAGGLADVLGGLLGGGKAQAAAPGASGEGAAGSLGGMLGQALNSIKGTGGKVGTLGEMAKDVFGQATTGVKDAAGKINEATGAGGKLEEVIKQMTGGQGSADLIARAKELVKNNPAAAGALAGALGALVLGTRGGRSIAIDAAKLGGLVLIGGLAYKAWQNYQSGQQTTASASGPPQAAPAGSGFDQAQSNDNAALYIRAMIAAAAADGEVDAAERERIIGGLRQVGLDPSAASFLEQEFSRPAAIAELARHAGSPEIAAQVYTAARVAIEPDTPAEQRFLADLAGALRLDPGLAGHIDAATRSVRA